MSMEYIPLPKHLRYVLQLYKVLRLRRRPYNTFVAERVSRRLGFHAGLIRMLAEYLTETS